jgi:signal transduction histidine kinase
VSTADVTLGVTVPEDRPTARLGWWAPAAFGIGVVLTLGLVIVARSVDGGRPGWVVGGLLILAWLAAGLSLLRRACPLGRLALVAAGGASIAYAGFAARAAALPDDPSPLADFAAAFGLAMLPAIGLHLLLALPNGFVGTPTRRWLAIIGYGSCMVGVVIWMLGSRTGGGWAVLLAAVLAVATGLGPANQRYREATGVTKQRLQWIGCAVAVAGEIALVVLAMRVLLDWPHAFGLVAAAASITIPLAMLASTTPLVSRVDRLLVTTVSFTGLTGVVVAVYLVIVIGLGPDPTDKERNLLVLSMIAAGVAALLYLPARERLHEQANRLVYGERHAPDEALKTFGSRLSRAIPMDELLLQLAESLRKTMNLRSAEIWTGKDGRYDLAVSVPDQGMRQLRIEDAALPVVTRAGVSGQAWVAVWLPDVLTGREDHQIRLVPISHSGELLGLIILDRPRDGDAFTEEDDQALADLVRQVALALHNVNLDSALQASLDEVRRYAGELQASRARIVATGDAERRKIERNLHDGAQQHLVALAVNLRLVRDLVEENPDAAEMLEMLADSVKDTIQELRDLAHGIYPPLLMDSGLPEALRAAAARSPLEVTVEADVARYPTEVEAAVYFCCLEAMQNAAKHAPQAHVNVRVWEDEETRRLRFAVTDDGPGFDVATATAGHGYVNMSDRLGAIGGEVDWTSSPGDGATVAGAVPVAA